MVTTASTGHGAGWWRSAVIYQVRTEPGVLAFTRGGGFCCVVNCSTRVVATPVDGELLLASHLEAGDKVPPNSAAWYQLSTTTPPDRRTWHLEPPPPLGARSAVPTPGEEV